MKIARFQSNGHIAHGVVEGDEVVEIEGDIYSEFKANGERHKLADVKLLVPTDPKEIWAPGLNFANLGRGPLRRRGGGRHRQAVPPGQPPECGQLHSRLHLRQRRFGARLAER